MRLYCRCGCPIWVAGHWTGEEYLLTLHEDGDGQRGAPVTGCPRCGARLRPADLEWLAPAPSRWPAHAHIETAAQPVG
jgi:hypothetical protein